MICYRRKENYLFGKKRGDGGLQIAYDNGRVQKIFENYAVMSKKIGPDKTRAVKQHIDRLRAAPTFQSFLNLNLGRPHMLTGDNELKGNYGVSVSGNVRLIIQPDCAGRSVEELRECHAVIVRGVGDYHGGKMEWLIP